MKGKPLSTLAHELKYAISQDMIIKGFAIDSRKILPGEVFFALKGEKVDGHNFLKDVSAKGAIAAVVSKEYQGDSFGIDLFKVDDVLVTLQQLAASIISQNTNLKVVAVTGSVGKTTTKEFISQLLDLKYRVAKTPDSYNSQAGLPVSILNSEGNEEIFVIEMGMNVPGEIKKLVKIAPPHVAVITRIGIAHTEFFSDGIEGIAKAKAEIFSHPKTQLGIVNAQCLPYEVIANAGSCPKISFASEELSSGDTDYMLKRYEDGFYISEKGGLSPVFTLPFDASHLCENFACAAAVARHFDLSWEEIIFRAQSLTTYKRRFEKIEKDNVLFINDSYNANPESMRAALANLPKPQSGARTIAVLGSMKELGSFSQKSHRQIGETALNYVDHLFCLGKECLPMVEIFSHASRPVEFFLDLKLLRERLFEVLAPGDVVLIKGSNSLKLWQIIEEE
jgi:UDP-N-acetylmuramoyl-tripeptide--D-alanyl-D-alanine ligase